MNRQSLITVQIIINKNLKNFHLKEMYHKIKRNLNILPERNNKKIEEFDRLRKRKKEKENKNKERKRKQ